MRIYAAQGLTQEAKKCCCVILAMNAKDQEALSVQASLGTPDSDSARETSSPANTPAVPQMPQPALAVTSETDTADHASHVLVGVDPQSESSASIERDTGHAAAIAQLESWLRTLEQQRRDRPTSGAKL